MWVHGWRRRNQFGLPHWYAAIFPSSCWNRLVALASMSLFGFGLELVTDMLLKHPAESHWKSTLVTVSSAGNMAALTSGAVCGPLIWFRTPLPNQKPTATRTRRMGMPIRQPLALAATLNYYRVSRCGRDFPHLGQNFLSSMRSGLLRRFFLVM